MALFRKKPVVVEATQWFKNGDHPQDDCEMVRDGDKPIYQTEGEVIRRYRHPAVSGDTTCHRCSGKMHEHGWIDTLEGGHIVCPGDWVITGVQGERYPCKPAIFVATYDEVK